MSAYRTGRASQLFEAPEGPLERIALVLAGSLALLFLVPAWTKTGPNSLPISLSLAVLAPKVSFKATGKRETIKYLMKLSLYKRYKSSVLIIEKKNLNSLENDFFPLGGEDSVKSAISISSIISFRIARPAVRMSLVPNAALVQQDTYKTITRSIKILQKKER